MAQTPEDNFHEEVAFILAGQPVPAAQPQLLPQTQNLQAEDSWESGEYLVFHNATAQENASANDQQQFGNEGDQEGHSANAQEGEPSGYDVYASARRVAKRAAHAR